MRLLEGFGNDIPRGEIEELPVELDGLLGEARDEDPHRFLPHVALVAHAPPEGMELHGPLPFAEPQLHATPAQEIEGGHALRHANRMIGGKLDDAVAETDAARALAGRPEEDFRRGGVRVLLQEVVLDLPRVVVAQPVGQLDLGQRVLQEPMLAVEGPGSR